MIIVGDYNNLLIDFRFEIIDWVQVQSIVQRRLAPANYSREILGVINVDAPDSRKLKVRFSSHGLLLLSQQCSGVEWTMEELLSPQPACLLVYIHTCTSKASCCCLVTPFR